MSTQQNTNFDFNFNSNFNFSETQKIIFSSPINKTEKFAKLTGRRVKIKDKEYIQFEGFHNNQAFHENILIEDLHDFFHETILKYRQADLFLIDSQYMAFNKTGKISVHKTKTKSQNKSATPNQSDHNRRKNYIISEGDNLPILIELGVFTKDYKIVNSVYNKFRQINRFIELFDDMSGKFDEIYKKYGRINAVDFGCGKSYLTFILYYYFVSVKKYPEDCVNITGIDLKQKVMDECNDLAQKYGYKNLKFVTGDINGYDPKPQRGYESKPHTVHIIVSLHGCDTATDYAVYNGLKWQSDVIFTAPCCEHEINAQINANAEPMRNILKYGIVKERFSALLTNSIRCNILETQNYKTELIEFVDISHSPKNLLIRAVKTNNNGLNRPEIKKDLDETLQKFGIKQKLYDLLFL